MLTITRSPNGLNFSGDALLTNLALEGLLGFLDRIADVPGEVVVTVGTSIPAYVAPSLYERGLSSARALPHTALVAGKDIPEDTKLNLDTIKGVYKVACLTCGTPVMRSAWNLRRNHGNVFCHEHRNACHQRA